MFKENRLKIVNILKETVNDTNLLKNSCILLKGSYDLNMWDTDFEYEKKIESNFYYAFGCELNNIYGLINWDNLETILIFPKMSENEIIFYYKEDKEKCIKKYGIDDVIHFQDFKDYIQLNNIRNIFVSNGIPKVPSGKDLLNLIKIDINIDENYLYSVINEARCIKNDEEIKILKIASKLSSHAHIEVIKETKIGMYEYQLQSIFLKNLKDCEELAYDSICAGGENASILHYTKNDKILKNSELVLNDMGGKYKNYCSDITCTYPINGKFTEKQKEIYNIVWKAHDLSVSKLKVGANMINIEEDCLKFILNELIKLKLVEGDLNELLKKEIDSYFMMHSLGHYIGLRVHDVGLPINKITFPGEKNFKNDKEYFPITLEKELKENMLTTIEPGIYFNEKFWQLAKENKNISKIFNFELIEKYRKEVGGVRIEDIYIIKKEYCECITFLPRTISQIEACMSGKDWKFLNRYDY